MKNSPDVKPNHFRRYATTKTINPYFIIGRAGLTRLYPYAALTSHSSVVSIVPSLIPVCFAMASS